MKLHFNVLEIEVSFITNKAEGADNREIRERAKKITVQESSW